MLGECNILIDFVGPSMMSWLMTVNHRWTGALFSFVATSFRLMYSILMYVIDLDVCQYRMHQSERRGEAYVSAA
jgi:hypothetical protein